ncbi:MAG: hypothetical protein NXH89_15725, partial [Cyclobacteriaceae bacterium]|nr:hypothetical protein [Cyclobacteriaceae bacterium]
AILGMGALTSKFYERYLLPVAPVLAVWIAWIGIKSGVLERIKSLMVASVFFLFMILVLTGVSLWINFGLVGNFWLRLQAGLGVIFLIYAIYTGLKTPEKLPKIISYTLLMIFFLLSSITYHISLPHQGTQAASLIQAENIREPIAFYGNLHAGSKIRMSLGPDYKLIDLPKSQWQAVVTKYQFIILEDRWLEEMDLTVYEVKTASRNWDSKAIPNLLSQIHKAEFEELLEANSKKYYLLRKK